MAVTNKGESDVINTTAKVFCLGFERKMLWNGFLME